MIQKIRVAGATEVLQHGSSWYEADIYLREKFIDNQCDAADRKNIYVPPFEHEYIRAGAAGIVSEIANQLLPRENTTDGDFPADAIVCSVGGGGLFNGIVRGLDEFFQFPKPPNVIRNGPKDVYVITTETFGAHSLAYSLEHGSLQTLPAITSQATSLGALRVATKTFENAVSPPAGIQVRSVLGTDMEAADGVVLLSDEHRLQVELACGISVFVAGTLNTYNIVPDLTPDSRVVVVVCGGSNINAEMIAEYRQKLSTGWN
ncbi:hypothetical protein EYZ11_002189 [Aspergillus tanneri]|uniref:L-serine ammonia-lyase n=1 Tax=Aspergillus tanneri TaxID=1220188 RepID=A0A4S3JT95_9EURO|nr:uncharacterized protein ATNIH1004_008946 [Aspergillus tanneri]KAA8644739.1 hypothetical protein ATNIH1004_008946 [Aspergillus tanneri]THC98328.1 hypothetical protein EYZ11_002189 [Aspergillus tanneri]